MAEQVIFPASVCLSEVKQNARSILENQRLTLCIPGKNYLMHQDSDETFSLKNWFYWKIGMFALKIKINTGTSKTTEPS